MPLGAAGVTLSPADGFGGLFPGLLDADNRLVVRNDAEAPRLVECTAAAYEDEERIVFELRAANRHSVEGKRYTYRDAAGHTRRLASTEWGVAWDLLPDGRRSSFVVSAFDTMEGDSFGRRLMHYRLAVADSLVAEGDIERGVNTIGGFNTIIVKLGESTVTVAIGDAEPVKVAEWRRAPQAGSFAVLVGKAAKVEVALFDIDKSRQPAAALDTGLTLEQLNRRFAATTDIYEGYWEYLDRSLRESRVRLGGRYRLALVADGRGGYHIIYIEGAQVEGARWRQGMLKGRLRPIGFVGQYDLTWYDATMGVIDHDANARFVSADVLELAFPLESSIVRFKRLR